MEYLKKEHLPHRVLFSIIFAMASVVMVSVIPDTYYKYFDKTQYYTVEQPVDIEKEVYEPCQSTVLTVKRKAILDLVAESVIDLNLIRMNGDKVRIIDGHIKLESAILRGDDTIKVAFPLPCGIEDGKYFWQAIVSYRVRDIEKNYTFITENFQVATPSATPAPTPEVRIINRTVPAPTATPGVQPQAGQSGQQTVIINQQPEAKPKPTPEPELTPQPTPQPTPESGLCLPIVGCL